MLNTYCHDTQGDWDEGVPFAARKVVQESLGFSPMELVFEHTVQGPLKVIKDRLLSDSDTQLKHKKNILTS